MKYSLTKFLFVALFLTVLTANSYSQSKNEQHKPSLEKSKIAIKVKEGVGPYQRQEGSVSFGINSLDQIAVKYEVNKLNEMFLHKLIPKNSGLPDLSRIYQIEFPDKYNVVIVSQEFAKDPNIEFAEPIPINYLLEVPNDSLYNQQWYLHNILAPLAWDIHKGEDSDSVVVLSITDSGCRYLHPDMGQNIWNNLGEDADGDGHTFEWNGSSWVFDPDDINNIDDDGNGFIDDLIGWNIYSNNMDPNDGYGHGTAVSGLAGASTNNNIGVASISYNLKLMPVQVLNAQGGGTNTNAYNGLIYAAENGANVINCSWGGWPYSEANKEVVEYVSALGSIIVAAAGNSYNDEPIYPACYPYVIDVAAVDSLNIRTSYSSYGAGVDVSSPGPTSSQPFIALNLSDGYGNPGLGTSFSAPIVTGLVGLIKSYHPTWTNDQIIQQLLYTTDNIDQFNPGFEHMLGTGKINAYRSLADSNVVITPELKLILTLIQNPTDTYSKALYPDSTMNFSLRVQNCSHFLDANPLTIILTTDNPDVIIIDGTYSGLIPANTVVDLLDEYQIQIAPGAATALATLSFNASANLPVVAGSPFEVKFIINPRGCLVWEGVENGQDYSGEFIKNYLVVNSYPVLYTTESVLSYNGLDALFLSFGNFGQSGSNTVFDDVLAAKVQEYLESGGKVYIEGGDAIGYDQAGNVPLLNLLGIASAQDGSNNPIDNLQGQAGTLTEGVLFNSSTQVNNDWIDLYSINSYGQVSFIEIPYGNVGVQSTGYYGQKDFCFSYALSKLVDRTYPSTRNELLQRILDYFDVVVPVEIVSFTASVNGNSVLINWSTATETNNRGFDVQRSSEGTDYISLGFVNGYGTTTQQHNYSFTDKNLNQGRYSYRLKQYDFDGSFHYSDVVKVDFNIPLKFVLEQNYPNPFNPNTTIKFSLPESGKVILILFNLLGEEVAVVLNEEKEAGYHQVELNASNLPSGVYFYQIKANYFVETKKMILLK